MIDGLVENNEQKRTTERMEEFKVSVLPANIDDRQTHWIVGLKRLQTMDVSVNVRQQTRSLGMSYNVHTLAPAAVEIAAAKLNKEEKCWQCCFKVSHGQRKKGGSGR